MRPEADQVLVSHGQRESFGHARNFVVRSHVELEATGKGSKAIEEMGSEYFVARSQPLMDRMQ